MLGNAACFGIDGPSGRSGAFTELMSKWLDSEAPLASTSNPVISFTLFRATESHRQCSVGGWADVSACLIYLASIVVWLKGTKVCQSSIHNCMSLTETRSGVQFPEPFICGLGLFYSYVGSLWVPWLMWGETRTLKLSLNLNACLSVVPFYTEASFHPLLAASLFCFIATKVDWKVGVDQAIGWLQRSAAYVRWVSVGLWFLVYASTLTVWLQRKLGLSQSINKIIAK